MEKQSECLFVGAMVHVKDVFTKEPIFTIHTILEGISLLMSHSVCLYLGQNSAHLTLMSVAERETRQIIMHCGLTLSFVCNAEECNLEWHVGIQLQWHTCMITRVEMESDADRRRRSTRV